MDDGSETRIDKLYRIIQQSSYGVHDLSRTELDKKSKLPRFNMPLELGIFLGAKRFGGKAHSNKRCLILDKEQYRFQQFISDLAGMDITAHAGDPDKIVGCTRDWLSSVSKRVSIPSRSKLLQSFRRFTKLLPKLCRASHLNPNTLIYSDFERLTIEWMRAERKSGLL